MADDDARETGPPVSDGPLDLPRLVAEHSERLYRYAFRLTGSAADAEDLTQQTFLIAHRKLDQLRDPRGAWSWLLTVMRHCYGRTERKSRPERTRTVPMEIDQIPAEVAEQLEFDDEELQAAINGLPDEYKLVVLGFYFEGRSYRELAEQLELPLGTVMSRLSRAKAHLRGRLMESQLQIGLRRET